jgi:predicted transcriptional regulator
MSKANFDIKVARRYCGRMTIAKRNLRKTRAPAVGTKRKATTFRLDPALQVGLTVLGQVLKQPLNRLVNEAVRGFIEKRSAQVEVDLERTLKRLKASRRKDPDFESAIAQFVEAEASLGRDDPIEGKSGPTSGPAQRMVHELLNA